MAVAAFPASACVLLTAAAVVAVSASAAPQVFVVGGGPRGWRKPIPNEETYNHWAARNRFHVGDFLHFKYERNDSVLLVSRDDYKLCGAAKPTQRFDGGDTRFRLDHSGFIYFISGAPGHCGAGQRMTARVMAQHDGRTAPAEAPAMSPGGEDGEGGSYGGPGSGARSSGGSKPGSGAGSVSGSTTTTPHYAGADRKASGAAPMRASSSFGGYHVVVGFVLGAVLLVMTA